MDGAGSYSVAQRAGLLPTELTGMWGWILLRSPHQGRGAPPAGAPTTQRPAQDTAADGWQSTRRLMQKDTGVWAEKRGGHSVRAAERGPEAL